MRNLYLVRHGKVEFTGGEHRCIGKTDLQLNHEGIRQAQKLKSFFSGYQNLEVFSSPLIRARKTAEILSDGRFPVKECDGLRELDMGEWENVPLFKLNKRLESEPERGEKRAEGLERIQKTVKEILNSSNHDVVCVAHAGINCCFLSWLLNTPLQTSRGLRQPYGGVSYVKVENNGGMRLVQLGEMPESGPDEETCQELFERYRTPDKVRRHCRSVQKKAIELGMELKEAGIPLDLRLISASALLHDLVRHEVNHAEAGARILEREGYPRTAQVIRQHHDLGECAGKWIPDEVDVVYLADKMVSGEKYVLLEERFMSKMERFILQGDTEAAEACNRRFQEAISVEKRIVDYLR